MNTLNPPPITSLTQLLPEGSTPPTMERTLAAIMARFERMWAEFVHERGSFAPFMDLYLDRWLHSYVSSLSEYSSNLASSVYWRLLEVTATGLN